MLIYNQYVTLQEPWNPRDMSECMNHTLVEFTKAAVKTAEVKRGVSNYS